MKIMHISDLHFGMHNTLIADTFLHELERVKPDAVLISGDLTQRATEEQYELFSAFSKKMSTIVLPIPGNHDIPLYPHQLLMRWFYPFSLYKRYVNDQIEVEFENSAIRILGVNSVNPYRVKKGRLSSKTMSYIQTYFSKPFSGLNILFFHHNFDRLEGAHKPLENYEELITYLKTSAIDLVCAGHSHYANINLIEKNNQQACVFLHAGSLLCTRSRDGLNSYYVLEINNNCVQMEWQVFTDNSFQLRKKYNLDLTQPFSVLSLETVDTAIR